MIFLFLNAFQAGHTSVIRLIIDLIAFFVHKWVGYISCLKIRKQDQNKARSNSIKESEKGER
jgi:hypothetical protein